MGVPERARSLGPLGNEWWESRHRRASLWLLALPARLCGPAARFRLGSVGGDEIAHLVLLNLVLCIPYAVFDQYRHDLTAALHALIRIGAPGPFDPDLVTPVARYYPLAHAVFAASCIVPRAFRNAVLLAGSLGIVVATPYGDAFSVALLAAYLVPVWTIARVRSLGLAAKLSIVMATYVGFLNLCQLLDGTTLALRWPFSGTPAIVGVATFASGIVPMLWYSVHEISSGRMKPRGFGFYLFCRFFTAPVFSPRELRIEEANRERWQWRGVGALGSAFVGAWLYFALRRRFLDVHHPDWFSSSGWKLWGYSIVFYLAFGFRLQATLNLFVGLARLAGIPVESNFYFWALARTPNERWRRWNRLFREWILTYVFYPMMRAKKGLFFSIMATLLSSGSVHVMGALTPGRFDAWAVSVQVVYWTLNGLAIYSVILVPRRWPGLVERLGLPDLAIWSVAGMLATSATFGALFVARDRAESWSELGGYFSRLLDLFPGI